MLTILITQAFDLPVKKEDVSANIKISCGSKTFTTVTVADYPGLDSLNPFFDGAFHIPLTADLVENGKAMDVTLSLMNKEHCLGTISVDHGTMVSAPDKIVTKKQAIGEGGASLEYRIILRGVSASRQETSPDVVENPIKVATSTDNAAVPPLQEEPRIKVTMVKGTGFQVQKNRRRLLKKKDIPDVYCVTKFGSSPTAWRTTTIKDSVTPEWNESQVYPFLNHSQILHIEVYDEDSRGGDDHIGTIRLTTGKILLAGGTQDVEIELDGKPTGCFITISCELINN